MALRVLAKRYSESQLRDVREIRAQRGNVMRALIFALAAAATAAPLAAMPVAASDKSDVLAVVKQLADSQNNNDMKAFVAACAPQAVVVDEFAPFVWQGATACSDWWNANDANNKQIDSTDGILAYGKPVHLTVTGDHAYIVLPAKFTDTEKGKKVVEHAVWIVTLQKAAAGWSMTGSTWAQH
jgi:hypothetical protein